jgi:hypothetical protein
MGLHLGIESGGCTAATHKHGVRIRQDLELIHPLRTAKEHLCAQIAKVLGVAHQLFGVSSRNFDPRRFVGALLY